MNAEPPRFGSRRGPFAFRMVNRLGGIVATVAILGLAVSCASPAPTATPAAPLANLQSAPNPFGRLSHIVVIYQENWSFDGLYGLLPGVNGLNQAGATVAQVGKDGEPYAVLPQPINL